MEDHYTKIQNEILEILAKVELAGGDFRIINAILRKTNGWNKEEDWISLTQFELLTGLSRKSVVKSLQRLVNAKILLVTKSKLVSYKLNTDVKKWVVTKSKLVTKCTPTSYQMEQKVVTKSKHTKETITKEIIQSTDIREAKASPYDEFIQMFNTVAKRNFSNRDTKAQRQYEILRKKGVTLKMFEIAIKAVLKDSYHQEQGYKYLTPEFITRSDKLEKFLNTDFARKYINPKNDQQIESNFKAYLDKLKENNNS